MQMYWPEQWVVRMSINVLSDYSEETESGPAVDILSTLNTAQSIEGLYGQQW